MAVNSNELKASVRLDGGAQFKKDIADVNSNLKQLDAESKKVTEEFRGQANSVEALRAKQEILNQTFEQAEKKVQLYDSRIKSLEQQQKRIAESTEDYRDQLKNAQEALSKMDRGTDAYTKQEKAVEALARKVQLGEQNQQRATNEIAKYRTEQTKAETAVAKLNHEINDNSKYLDEAEHSADKCADSIDEYGRRTKQAAEESQELGDVAKVALGNLAADAAQKLADAAVDAAKAVVEVGSSFEESMSKVKAISGASGSAFDQLSAKAKTLGASTKFTATEVADGFSYMSLAGWDTAQMLDAIDGVVNLAAASEMDLGEASDMVTDYLSAFGLAASDAGKMVDEMVFAQSHSNTSTKQLGDAFGNCAANMSAAGQSMETTTAILEAMANQGTKGSEAGSALAAVMRDITSKMKDGAISIGNTSVRVTDAQGNFRSLVDILADVEKATDGMGTAQKASALQSTFTARSIKAVNQVLNEGTDSIKSYQDALEGSDGAAKKTAATMMDNFKGAMTQAQSAAEGLGVALFEKVSKPMTAVVEGAAGMMGALTNALTPPANSDLQNYLQDIHDEIEQTKADLDNIGNIELKAETNTAEIEAYRDVLEKATKGEELSEFEKYQLKTAVEKLGGSIPELADAYDSETDSINLTTEALDALLESTEKQIRQQAYTDVLESAYKAQAEAALEAAKAQSAYESATEELQKKLGNISIEDFMMMSPADQAAYFGYVNETVDEVNALAKAHVDAAKAVEDANKVESDAAKVVGDTENAYKKLTGTVSDNNNAAKKNTKEQEKENETIKKGEIQLGGFVNMNKNAAKAKAETAKATEENTEATEAETDAFALLGQAMQAATGFAEEHSDQVKGFFEEAGEKTLDVLKEKVKASAEAEKNALETTRQAYEDNYNAIKNTLDQKLSLWDAFNGGEDITVEQMIENLQSQTEGIIQYKEEMAAVIAEYGDKLGPDLINTLQSMGTDAANTWHHMFVTMSQDNAPGLFAEMGQQWAEGLNLSDQIAKYCAGNLTAYEVATNQLGSTKIEWTGLRESVQKMTPELDTAITAAQEAGIAIPDGLADGLASGETSALDAIALLTGSLKGTFDGLYEIAEQSGVDIPEGLSKGMEGSADEYEAAIGQLTEALSSAGTDAGTAAAESIGTAMTDSSDTVETAAEDTAGAAATAADGKKADFESAGSTSATQYASGITSQKAQATSAGRLLGQAAKSGADSKKESFKDAGANMARALAAGIRAGQSDAINAAVNMAVEAYRRAKSAIGQHSPTGIFKDELGKNIPLAVAAGITENTAPAQNAAATMARSTFDAARYAAMTDAMTAQSIATPAPTVNVDTSPIARMIGSSQSGVQVINYNTFNGVKDPKAFADQFAEELQQRLRS